MKFKVISNAKQFGAEVALLAHLDFPRELESTARKAGRVVAFQTQIHIPGRDVLVPGQREPSSGRLRAGFGVYNPNLTNNPESSPSDVIFEVNRRGNRVSVTVGTNIPYAEAVNNGFTMDEERRVFIPSRDGFRMVQPFEFSGYHFLEQGLAEAKHLVMNLYNKDVAAILARKQFNVAAQLRDRLGRFLG